MATALAAATTTFNPLIAIRPGYWTPAHFASSAATLDQLSGGRVKVNIVSRPRPPAAVRRRRGRPGAALRPHARVHAAGPAATGPRTTSPSRASTTGAEGATLEHKPVAREGRPHPQLYFGGASEAAQRTAAAEADVQLFWGEPLDGVAARIDHLRTLSAELDRDLPPLEFGLRITTLVRDTTEEAWADAEARVAAMAAGQHEWAADPGRRVAVGQQRLLDLAEQGDVLDDCLYTAPGRVGGGGAGTTWLVGSPDDVAKALRRYADLGVTHFVLSDTPYEQEIVRVGDSLLPLLRTAWPSDLSAR